MRPAELCHGSSIPNRDMLGLFPRPLWLRSCDERGVQKGHGGLPDAGWHKYYLCRQRAKALLGILHGHARKTLSMHSESRLLPRPTPSARRAAAVPGWPAALPWPVEQLLVVLGSQVRMVVNVKC